MWKQIVVLVVLMRIPLATADEPYFEDTLLNIQKHWMIDATPLFSGVVIRPFRERGEVRGELHMENRVTLLTQSDFPDGAHVSVRTAYKDTGNPLYVNQCIIVMRTDGAVSSKRSWEITNGLRLRIEYGHGKVTLEYVDPATAKSTSLSATFVKANDAKEGLVLVKEAPKKYTIPQVTPGKENWFTVELSDNPKVGIVEAFLSWNGRRRTKVASVTYQEARALGCDIVALSGKKIALSSREFIARKMQISYWRDVKIAPAK